MRARIAVLGGLLFAGGCVSAGAGAPDEAASGDENSVETKDDFCVPPERFEAQYSDGKTLLRAQPVENSPGLSQWTYYLPGGRPLATEERKDGHLTRLTIFHSSGAPFISGDVSPELRAHGVWEMSDENGALQARAFMSDGEIHQTSAEAWDPSGGEIEWSLPEEIFAFREAHPFEELHPPFLANDAGAKTRQRTCTMVCLDEKGGKLGIFRLAPAGKKFDEASEAAIYAARFEPRLVGATGLPSCIAVGLSYEILWATKALRLPRPIQRRPRGRY